MYTERSRTYFPLQLDWILTACADSFEPNSTLLSICSPHFVYTIIFTCGHSIVHDSLHSQSTENQIRIAAAAAAN